MPPIVIRALSANKSKMLTIHPGGGDNVMARTKDPNRDQAHQIWLNHGGNITN
ncbi:phage terminase small subunit-related protein [Paenibacillus sp. NPDC058177]|uniref:phage terminase small subunit-related protein n=1 Tax=Paenibacillus sp. NPDC058177 TaxID=3346369 RepID=UPI0036DD2A30